MKRELRTNDKTAKWDASQVGWRQSEPVLELIWMTLKWVEQHVVFKPGLGKTMGIIEMAEGNSELVEDSIKSLKDT